MHRPDLNGLSPAERAELAQLIDNYASPAIVAQHQSPPPGIHSNGAIFLSWHRNYILGLENYLIAQGRPEWAPLPAWDPASPIPPEFNIPGSGPDALRDLTPNVSFSPQFDHVNLGNFETEAALGNALMGPHGTVHIRVGGLMGDFRSPSAPIFWPWHSFLDDIWWEWQRQTVVTPDCLGQTLAQARATLTAVGLAVGTVTTSAHPHLPFPFPDPFPDPFPEPSRFPFFPFPWPPPRPRPLVRRHRHVVIEQDPDPGDRVHHGVAVDLILGQS